MFKAFSVMDEKINHQQYKSNYKKQKKGDDKFSKN